MSHPLSADLDQVLAQGGDLWDGLRGARLFLTGGTGFFGCWLLETLLWANDRLGLGASAVVLTRDGAAFRAKAPHLAAHAAVTLYHGDVRTFDFPDGAFSHVVHAATQSSAPLGERDLGMFETIVDGTRRTLAFAGRAGASRFLFISSGAVYGRQPSDLSHVPEDFAGAPDPLDARNVYAEGKRAAELLCALHADGRLQPVIARCFAFVGPYLPIDAHFAVGNFIRDGLAGGPIRVNGDGTAYRSYLYAADLALWLWTILLRGAPLRAYNVGGVVPVQIGQLAKAVAQAFSPEPTVVISQPALSGAPPSRYLPSTKRAEIELALQQTVDLKDALKRTVAWETVVRKLVRNAPMHLRGQ